MAPTFSPQQFVEKWRKTTLKEKSAYQEHFADLCRLVGHPTPVEDDPTGQRFTYEAGATKQKGGQGWADVWKKGYFAIEYKGRGGDLDKAYQQLLQYRESLHNPPLLVVCDLEIIRIHTNFTNTVKQIHEITYDSLVTPAGFQRLRDMFTNPEAFRVAQTTEQVTQEAAKQFAELAKNLRKWKHESADIAHFLIRLLFCLFAEDVDLLPKGLFSQLVARSNRNTTAFSQRLKTLFGAMATGGPYGNDEILYFNGRLFDDDRVIDLDSDALDVLVKVSQLDWSSIEPAIFGTLFERSLDPAKRSQLGAHYTSKEDILLIVEPVLMAPLRRKWAEIQAQARELEAQRDQAAPKQQAKLTSQMQELVTGFAGEIAQVKVLDPACGSGNFLYVALKQLLDLEKEVITFAGNIGLTRPFPQVGPEQLRGIEINEYAHELAQITVWIGYIQWLRDNGFGRPSEPILKPLDTIKHMDAILAIGAENQLYEPKWPEADVVIGNPPFLGNKRLRQELGDKYVDNILSVYAGRLPGEVDLVCYWFKRASDLLKKKEITRAGLIATNSIRGGANRKVLDDIENIFMAWSDRPWIINGAAVRVSIVGFDSGQQTEKLLNGLSSILINPDLTGTVNLTKAKQLNENKGISFMGDTKLGDFDMSQAQAQMMLADKGNPNGKPNSDVIRPWINALDVTRRPRNLWVVDFGISMSEEEAALYEKPFEHVRKFVKPTRDVARNDRERKYWWLHRRPAPDMRSALHGLSRFIVTPSISKYRLFIWAKHPVLPDHALLVFARSDDYFFGVLHSKPHEFWSLRMGTSLEDRPRYTPTTTFETFPFPWPLGQEPVGDPNVQAIAKAACELVEKRDNWLNPAEATIDELKNRTLTNLYNQRPAWLDNAHKKLDKAVFAAYGWPENLSDEEILERLLALNLERAKANPIKTPPSKEEDD